MKKDLQFSCSCIKTKEECSVIIKCIEFKGAFVKDAIKCCTASCETDQQCKKCNVYRL